MMKKFKEWIGQTHKNDGEAAQFEIMQRAKYDMEELGVKKGEILMAMRISDGEEFSIGECATMNGFNFVIIEFSEDLIHITIENIFGHNFSQTESVIKINQLDKAKTHISDEENLRPEI